MLLKTMIGAAALLAAPAAFAQSTTPTDPMAPPATQAPAPAPEPDPAPAPGPDAATATPAPDPATPSQDPVTSQTDKKDRKKEGKKKPH